MEQNWHHPAVAPFPSMAHGDKCSSKQSSLLLSLTPSWCVNFLEIKSILFWNWFCIANKETLRVNTKIRERPHAKLPWYGACIFLCRALYEVFWPCCGVRCYLGENCTIGTQSHKQPCEKEKMSVAEIKRDICVCHKGCERSGVYT